MYTQNETGGCSDTRIASKNTRAHQMPAMPPVKPSDSNKLDGLSAIVYRVVFDLKKFEWFNYRMNHHAGALLFQIDHPRKKQKAPSLFRLTQ